MKNKAIIASWMSPERLLSFSSCNIAVNAVLAVMKIFIMNGSFMEVIGNDSLSEVAGGIGGLFYIYGLIIFILGVDLIFLARLSGFNMIDRKRIRHLYLTGTVNLIMSSVFLWM